jgi:hypothetical protein
MAFILRAELTSDNMIVSLQFPGDSVELVRKFWKGASMLHLVDTATLRVARMVVYGPTARGSAR